jgi:hypothetical protein
MRKTMVGAAAAVVLCLAQTASAQAAPQKEAKAQANAALQERRVRMLATVGIAEALELSDGEALKLSETFRVFEERKRPIRQATGQAMKHIKAAAEGDTVAQAQIDTHVKTVLEGRAQLAQIDRELFTALSVGQSAQKKAKLAIFIAKFSQELQKLKEVKERRAMNRLLRP